MQTDYKHSELTAKIIGAAMKVHNTFNIGFPENVYKNSLVIELKKNKSLQVATEVSMDVFYEDQWVGTRRLDIIVNNLVIVELKALSEMDDRCASQLLNYMHAFNIEVGLLINFGKSKLEFKRFYNTKFKPVAE